MLRAWQRCCGGKEKEPEERFKSLIKFLENEVEGVKRIKLAVKTPPLDTSSQRSYMLDSLAENASNVGFDCCTHAHIGQGRGGRRDCQVDRALLLLQCQLWRDGGTYYVVVTGVNLSSATGASLLATNTSHQYVKCVDIYPQPEPDILLAIGQANGKVVLTTFGPTAFDTLGLAGKELVPSHARQCNTVAWNPTDCNLLAAGLEKYRSDHSVLLWDVLKCPINTDRGPDVTRPVAELGYSETTHSLAWFNTQSRSLVVGSNNKHLKVLDLRDSAKAVNMTQTKAVYGLVVDPHNDYQIASFFENQIAIWDTRNFEKPILTLTQNKHVTKVLWCPTRHNLLGSLVRDSPALFLYDIQHTTVGNEEVEPSVLERSVIPGTGNNIASFSWHPSHENRLLAISLSGIFNETNLLNAKYVDLGYATREAIRKTKGVSEKEILLFRQDCKTCLQKLCAKLLERSPLKYKLTKAISFLDPAVAVLKSTRSERLKSTLEIVLANNWITGVAADLVDRQFNSGLTDYVVFERITLNWSPSSHVVWTHGRRFLKLITDKDQLYTKLNDTSVTIKRRALTEYGLKEDLWQNGDLADDDDLKNLWYWLYLSRSLVEEGNMWGVNSRLPGVRNVPLAHCLECATGPLLSETCVLYRNVPLARCLECATGPLLSETCVVQECATSPLLSETRVLCRNVPLAHCLECATSPLLSEMCVVQECATSPLLSEMCVVQECATGPLLSETCVVQECATGPLLSETCVVQECATGRCLVRHVSDDREKALQLCGWKFDRETTFMAFLDRLESDEAYSRAAAIAVFSLKLRLSIEILNRGFEAQIKMGQVSSLNIVAMALSGFSDDRNSMWRELCLKSLLQLTDPYLRAMFAFLTAENGNYDAVLNESGMAVEDQVAFALTFLSDQKLGDYLKHLTNKLVQEGDLAGMLLTGANSDGVELLQNYLDITGDVQSVSLLGMRVFPGNLVQSQLIQEWISNYRTLLNVWRLWKQRAQFDIAMSAYSPSEKPAQQVFVSCNFCGKSVSAQMNGMNRNRTALARLGGTSQKLKMSSCPQCRKPLPRCAICLVYMGTPSGQYLPMNNINGRSGSSTAKLAEFGTWFTWCQSCRHGGHAAHMTHWFREHLECPVTACTCRCISLDAACKVTPVLSSKT
uniref:WD repeat protein mio zinc-ribbon like domain-containing protein n=1 Tax=Timema shepardi TaxID=629360 RepID=A0A7R9B093_TIMSH|nr:unnamed protein product [Timema shepardi]